MTINAYNAWPTNAHLIEDVAKLGYLRKEWRTLDPTYGEGTFWKRWRPESLWTNDVSRDSEAEFHEDFRNLPWVDQWFDAVVFDPPYKLNGTPSEPDVRYGVDEPTSWQDRTRLIGEGLWECARVLGSGYLLVKCQDQVCSGKVRWQTDIVTEIMLVRIGLQKVDRFDMLGGRAQPSGRRQVHARRNGSTLLVFAR